jgi:hypothetical protein
MSTPNGVPAVRLDVTVWHKSSFSGGNGGNCVEAARLPGGEIAVRNSRDAHGPALIFTRAEIDAFVRGVKAGEFDHLT